MQTFINKFSEMILEKTKEVLKRWNREKSFVILRINICNWDLKRVNGQSDLVQVKSDPSHLVIGYTGTRAYGYGSRTTLPIPA